MLYDDGQGVIEPAYHFVLERYIANSANSDQKPVMIPYDFYIPISSMPLAMYPYMENSKVKPVQEPNETDFETSENE